MAMPPGLLAAMGAVDKEVAPSKGPKVPNQLQSAAQQDMAAKAPKKKGGLPPWLTKK